MNLNKISTEELEEELKRRNIIKEERPRYISKRDFELRLSELSRYCREGLESIEKIGYLPKDFKHYIYEECMKAFFGDDVFVWINKYNKGE
jgi:hypothetical protein